MTTMYEVLLRPDRHRKDELPGNPSAPVHFRSSPGSHPHHGARSRRTHLQSDRSGCERSECTRQDDPEKAKAVASGYVILDTVKQSLPSARKTAYPFLKGLSNGH